MSNDERLQAILKQPELDILRGLVGMSVPDLYRLEELEIDGAGRDRILDAIDHTLGASRQTAQGD